MVALKYKPSRDIPKAIRELKTLSPTRIREWIRDHRTKTVGTRKVQVDVTPQSVTMWLKRHRKIYEQLEQEIKEEEIPKEAISDVIFQNGFFEEIPSIKKWIMKLRARGAKEQSIRQFLGAIKQVCKGELRKWGGLILIEDWGLKHPDRLNLEDALMYISERQKRGFATRKHRLALRNFLKSKNIPDVDDISGKIAQMGKYAHLYTPKPKIDAIFEWLKPLNEDAYFASKFAYKCGGCRITATLTAEASKINREDHTIFVTEKATRGKGKRIQEKLIPEDLWKELEESGRLNGGRLFNIGPQELNGLLKSAYREVIPELAEEIPKPFHFWRHQFAQHLLRRTGWNYGLVAKLGHWTVETLERYYGKMDRETAFTEGRKHLPNL